MIVTLPDQLVKTDPVRSAEPPISSGRHGARASMACCEALRVATVSPFADCAATNPSAVAAKSVGNAPLIRRVNSAASAGCAARYAANFASQSCSSSAPHSRALHAA